MADNSLDVATGTSNLAHPFNESTGEPSATPDTGADLNATVSAEIDIAQTASQSLYRHDDRWRQLSDRLSHRPVAAPSLDIGGGSSRSVAREYGEHRQQWESQRSVIERNAVAAMAGVRALGTTLTGEFSATAVNENGAGNDVQTPSLREPERSSRFQREFLVSVSEISRSNDR